MAATPSPSLAFAINSTAAFATAELITIALHETGHALVAKSLGFAPVIHPFFETNPTGTPGQTLAIVAAGPLASLALGALFLIGFSLVPARFGYARLLLIWLGWLGVYQCVNYAIATPWLPGGDTARVAEVLGLPVWSRYVVAVVALIVAFVLARKAVGTMLALVPNDIALESDLDRRSAFTRCYYLPLIAGTALTGLGGIGTAPTAVLFGLLGCAGNFDIVGFGMMILDRPIAIGRNPSYRGARVEPLAIALASAIIVFYIAVLSRGIRI